MALRFPHQLPEPYRLPVIAAEAIARTVLATDLRTAAESDRHGYQHLHQKAVETATVRYLSAVCESFVQQASLAVQHRVMSFADVDGALEKFLALLQHHVYYGPHYETIRKMRDSREFVPFKDLTEKQVMTADWHTEYLKGMPALLATLDEAKDLPRAGDRLVRDRAERRRAFVNPRLGARGLSVTKWAELAGVDRSSVFDYLRGESNPRPVTLESLAAVLELKPDELP